MENLNIEQTLNEVKEGIVNQTMTKEQAELLIKKCDILIKKNKRNHEMAQNAVEKETAEPKEILQEANAGEKCYVSVNEELIDTLFIREEREGDGVRGTVESWFGIDLEEWEDGVYVQGSCGKNIYFFDENDMLVGVSEFHNWTGSCEKVEKNLDELYQSRDGYWYDRRTDCKIKICQTRKGLWLVLDYVDDYDRYRGAIRDFENSLM